MSQEKYTSYLDFPVAFDSQMPLAIQDYFLYFSLAVALFLFVYAVMQARKYNSAMPLLFIVGSLCCLPAEPVCNYLGQLFHAQIGQINAFETMDRPIPWHIVLAYVLYFSAVPLFSFQRIIDRKIDGKYLVNSYIVFAIFAYLYEIIPVSTGLWVYYGNQALWLWKGGMPLQWTFTNPIAVLTPMLFIYVALPYLKGWKQLLVAPLMGAGALMGYEGTVFIWQMAANSTWGESYIQIFGLLSIGMAWVLLWFYSCLLNTVNVNEKHLK